MAKCASPPKANVRGLRCTAATASAKRPTPSRRTGGRVTAYRGITLTPAGTPAAALDLDIFPGLPGGVFVG